jgi:hypothetical protein
MAWGGREDDPAEVMAMPSTPPRTACPDCGGELLPISLIDRGHHNNVKDLEYRTPDAKQSFWTGRWSKSGKVSAWACADCRRILLYAFPTRRNRPHTWL